MKKLCKCSMTYHITVGRYVMSRCGAKGKGCRGGAGITGLSYFTRRLTRIVAYLGFPHGWVRAFWGPQIPPVKNWKLIRFDPIFLRGDPNSQVKIKININLKKMSVSGGPMQGLKDSKGSRSLTEGPILTVRVQCPLSIYGI